MGDGIAKPLKQVPIVSLLKSHCWFLFALVQMVSSNSQKHRESPLVIVPYDSVILIHVPMTSDLT